VSTGRAPDAGREARRAAAECPRASKEQLDKAVAAAKAAYPAWAATPIEERRKLVIKMADVIEANSGELARLLTSEQGKPLADATGEVLGTKLGPLQNKMQYEKVKAFLEDARKNGKVVAGGSAMERPGYFIEPTIVRDIKEGSKLVDEEQFGPVLPLIKYSDKDDVIRRANATTYGLGASVWSSDINRAHEVAQKIEAGTVWINKHLDMAPHIPFGGGKQSGIGTEFAEEGLAEFTQLQIINGPGASA
jgi:acyl-CoA reductase-like NAD-dependent aldehyde dehydrogenase